MISVEPERERGRDRGREGGREGEGGEKGDELSTNRNDGYLPAAAAKWMG